jgi:hypothetical protein
LIKNLIYTSGGQCIKNAKEDLIEQDNLPPLPYNKLNQFYSIDKYYLGKTLLETIEKKALEAELKNYPILSNLQNIKNLINQNLNNYVALLSFVDAADNMKLTGKVGHYTFSVMKGIEQSVRDSFLNNQDKKVFMIMLYVHKTEEKRLQLYSKMITNKLITFKNEVIDKNTDATNYIMYRY